MVLAEDQLRLELNRAQIGEEVQALAQRQNAALRPIWHVGTVPFRPADRPQQHGVSCGRGFQRFIR